MKKFLSLFLSIVMLFSITAGIDMSAYASYDNIYEAYNYTYGETYYGCTTYTDKSDYLKFVVPYSGKIIITFYAYPDGPYGSEGYADFRICNSNGDILESTRVNENENLGCCYVKESRNYSPGTYYFYNYFDYYFQGDYADYNVTITYQPNISIPSAFKVSSRNTTSLKLSWNKVAGVSGYQLQRKSGNSYKNVANTSATNYTVKNLSAGTNYAFRVRAYKTISGKKYYSSWTYLTTPTKPSKPSIKTPSTNKKHQITAKWKKVSRCSGYQVQYSRKKNFSKVIATKTVSGSSKTSYTGKNFTKGKKYYVRVRSYKTVNGTKYYSAWSSVKSIKCK